MPYVLTVTEPMDGYVLGQRIYDQSDIDRIIKPGHSHTVKRVWVDDRDMPKPEPVLAASDAEPKGKAKADQVGK